MAGEELRGKMAMPRMVNPTVCGGRVAGLPPAGGREGGKAENRWRRQKAMEQHGEPARETGGFPMLHHRVGGEGRRGHRKRMTHKTCHMSQRRGGPTKRRGTLRRHEHVERPSGRTEHAKLKAANEQPATKRQRARWGAKRIIP